MTEPMSRGTPRPRDRGALAVALQETFTAIVRLRVGRQAITDGVAFRDQFKQLLTAAHDEAARAGYDSQDTKLAIYAATVFLDESVLNSPQPALAGWSRRPLQEELFGEHLGGEVFFDKLRGLFARHESEDLADLLEVFQLCLLLGFRGRYATGGRGELERWAAAAADKVERIRGRFPGVTPGWAAPAGESFPLARDPWVRALAAASVTVLAIAFITWLLLGALLRSQVAELAALPRLP